MSNTTEEFGLYNKNRIHQTAYEGASTTYRLEQKGLGSGSQDYLASKEIRNLWARSHYLVRNNAVGVTAKKRLVANWIGGGISVTWRDPNGKINKKLQKEWDKWIAECNLDNYGNLYNTQAVWAGALFESGEIFTRMVIRKRKKSKIPLALQLLEAEMLDPMYNSITSDANPTMTRMGITLDPETNAPKTYNFWKNYPGEVNLQTMSTQLRQAVPAEETLHIFERERPGQWRGIPMLAPLLLTIYEMDELTDATLQRQKAAQAISWIFLNTDNSNLLIPGVARYTGTAEGPDVDGTEATPQPERRVFVEGAGGNMLFPKQGEDVKFASVEGIGNGLQTLLQQQWSQIASALGLAAHQITGDLSEVNFSSIRAALNELAIRIEMVQKNIFINLGMLPLCEKFRDLATLYINASVADAVPEFTLPKRLGVDPLKDAQADLMEVQAGFSTLESKQKERNTNGEQVLAERKELKASGVVLTSVPDTVPTPVPAAGKTSGSSSGPTSKSASVDKTRPTTN